MTMEPTSPVVSYSDALTDLSANDLDALALSLHDRATRQRVEMPYDAALALVEAAWVSTGAERSPYRPIIQVRVALKRVILEGHYHPEQLGAFLQIAYERATHPDIARAAIRLAERDAKAIRDAGPVSDDE